MLVAVTGASGHIGNVVCRRSLAEGHRVRALVRDDKRALAGLNVDLVQGDVLELSDLLRLCEGCDAVVHCAAIISVDPDPTGRVFHTNTQGALNVHAAAMACGVRRMVYISSVHAVTELPHELPYDETRPYKTAADGPYDLSKATAEQQLLALVDNVGPEVVVLRPSAALGPFDTKPSKLGAALIDLYRGKVPVLPAGGYDLVDVRDVARSVVAAITHGRNGEVYLLSGKYCTLVELARTIERVTGRRMPGRVLSFGVLTFLLPLVRAWAWFTRSAPSFTKGAIDALRKGHPRMDSTKAQRELGHSSRPLEESVRDFYTWQKEAGTIT